MASPEQTSPLPVRRRRSSEEVADRILEAAAEEFEQSGYAGATTAAIARRAGVTEAQIFRLHASKQALFRAAIFTPLNRHFADFQARSASDPGKGRDVAAAYIGELQEFMARHARMFLSLLVTNAYSPEASAGIDALDGLQDYFRQGEAMSQRRLGENPPVAPELMVRIAFAAVLANQMFREWLFPAGMATDDEIRDAIAAFVIQGIEVNGPV